METIAQQIFNLREEIRMFMHEMAIASLVVTTLASVIYCTALIVGKRLTQITDDKSGSNPKLDREVVHMEDGLYKVVMILIISFAFYIARQDHLVHRNASYIVTVQQTQSENQEENKTSTWESWMGQRKSRKLLLPIIDFGCSIFLTYLFMVSAITIRKRQKLFVLISSLLFITGAYSIKLGIDYGNW